MFSYRKKNFFCSHMDCIEAYLLFADGTSDLFLDVILFLFRNSRMYVWAIIGKQHPKKVKYQHGTTRDEVRRSPTVLVNDVAAKGQRYERTKGATLKKNRKSLDEVLVFSKIMLPTLIDILS